MIQLQQPLTTFTQYNKMYRKIQEWGGQGYRGGQSSVTFILNTRELSVRIT